MSRTVQYTNKFEADSEVVKEVFYDENRSELFVALHTGVICGYSNFPEWQYRQFKQYESKGQYWNWYIKNKFGTLNGDVNFAPYQEVKQSGKESFSVVVDIKGNLKFDIDADNVQAALDTVTKLVEKTLVDGEFFVKEVKFNK